MFLMLMIISMLHLFFGDSLVSFNNSAKTNYFQSAFKDEAFTACRNQNFNAEIIPMYKYAHCTKLHINDTK